MVGVMSVMIYSGVDNTSPSVIVGCSGDCHKVQVLLYSVCLDVIHFFNFWNELVCSGVSF